MSSETEVITCPACKHLLRVPADWLGQAVQCPECQARFTAPNREGGRLTEPVLLTPPPHSAPTTPRKRADPLLTLPAFGLMLVGMASLIINGYLGTRYNLDPDMLRDDVRARIAALREIGLGKNDPEADRDKLDAARTQQASGALRVLLPLLAVLGAVTFAGGLAIVRRKNLRLARIGCVTACFALPQLCCVPGAIFGLWGLLMLMSSESREHFA